MLLRFTVFGTFVTAVGIVFIVVKVEGTLLLLLLLLPNKEAADSIAVFLRERFVGDDIVFGAAVLVTGIMSG